MKIFIARHGEATFDAPSDEVRPLTERGATATQGLVERNIALLKDIEVIWCSRLTRAIQTAEIYSRALSLTPKKQTFLSPGSDPQRVLRSLCKSVQDENILIVSHQPLVGELVSILCQGNRFDAHPFVTSEVVVLETELPEAGLATPVANLLP